ncbi:hypothetical protein B0T26DRAFT_693112 [Lasiosphaeria miniovina]|uniref:Uncharacterized protein n=1 Tax=Lasiosphaeria miniovina TaxID=1954250 RepID=A0AA40B3P7_9PEZI|nr:uncharacterized protein B0T26DRAFT_693112 [Lasiosphaeria miniovina]KAK0727109.1 hypothetical protein B0T26DRAFT_693112 [Lasiosphaeria miniovina]
MKMITCSTGSLTESNTFGEGRAPLLPLQPSRTLRGPTRSGRVPRPTARVEGMDQ